jgi:hypothetical protein
MLPQLSQQLLAKWSDLPIDRRRPDHLSFLGVRTEVGDGYALFLTFADRDPRPCLAVKVPREPAAQRRLKHEWSLLNRFQQQGLHRVASSLPRPVLWETIGVVPVLVTTTPSGQPMRRSRHSSPEHFAQVGDWLVQLACATRSIWRTVTRRDLGGIAERLSAVFELSDREMKAVGDWIARCLKMVSDASGNLFVAHGNLHRRNIWLEYSHLKVVNWERSELTNLPLQDLFTFVTTYRFPAIRRGPIESHLNAFRATYLTDSPYADLVCQTITTYCHALDIPIEGIEAHFGIFLARAALGEHDQLLVAADRGYLPFLSHADRSARQPYQQAIKDQLWINLLRLLIEERGRFERGIHASTRRRFQGILVP